MSTEYLAKCKKCMHRFVLQKGGGFLGYQTVCQVCGSISSSPRRGPRKAESQMTEDEIIDYLKDKSRWTKDGRPFNPNEMNIIKKLTGTCKCRGEMIPEWDERVQYRCPICKCTDYLLMGGDIARD